MLRNVILEGRLSSHAPATSRLFAATPAKAIQLLELNYPGFIQQLREGHYHVVARTPDNVERLLCVEQVNMGFSGDLIIAPALEGSASGQRKGLLGAILGAVLIGAAFFFSGGALAAALPGIAGAAGLTYGSLAQFGFALLLNGVSTLLTPTPETDPSVDEARSFVFSGPVNIANQGSVVPLIYGKMMVGTYTVSTALDTEMLLGGLNNIAGTYYATGASYVITRSGGGVGVYMGDLVNPPETFTLTSFNGQAVTGPGSVSVGTYLTAILNPTGMQNTIMLNHVGAETHPMALGLEVDIPYEVTTSEAVDPPDSPVLSGVLTVRLGAANSVEPSTDTRYVPGTEAYGNPA